MAKYDICYDEKGNIRFVNGSQKCGLCQTKEDIIQFERDTIRKGLPIMEIAFICKTCAVKQNLIKESVQKK